MNHRAFAKIAAQPRDLPKVSQYNCEIIHIHLDGSHKNRRVIRIKGGSHHDTYPSNLMQEALPNGHLEDVMEGVHCNDVEKGGQGVPLPKNPTMLDGRAGHPIQHDL